MLPVYLQFINAALSGEEVLEEDACRSAVSAVGNMDDAQTGCLKETTASPQLLPLLLLLRASWKEAGSGLTMCPLPSGWARLRRATRG